MARKRKPPQKEVLDVHLGRHPCPNSCPAHGRMLGLFGAVSSDIDAETRTNGKKVPLEKQMVNGPKMRQLIAKMLHILGDALQKDELEGYPVVESEYATSSETFMGLALGAISDFCFNMEYIRRITDSKWTYCVNASDYRVYYPYLGICPRCAQAYNKLSEATLDPKVGAKDLEKAKRDQYFGNKVGGHYVGRIGERILIYILDGITKREYPDAVTYMVVDDQHDVDAMFFFDAIGVLVQIKSSPLVILPVVSVLSAPLTEDANPETGLPEEKACHTFTDFVTSSNDLSLYFPQDDSTMTIGPRHGQNWPYEPLLSTIDRKMVLKILENWISIFRSFEIPKTARVGKDVKRAYLTSGWGAPIDDNKTKAGLARSDNMMKGTYASLKYGAYYVQECQHKTLRTALVANIDPVHQYADYLEKLEDIRWGHDDSFFPAKQEDGGDIYTISHSELTYLFDGVFTFNNRKINDPNLASAWDLSSFAESLASGGAQEFLSTWGNLSE